jgi:hypothetical protein
MALILKDRVKESATSPGTGSVTLLGAAVGFQSFSVIGNGNTCYYTISDQGGPNWEVGIGTYSTTGPTLARTTVLSSSNAGSLTNFNAGTQDVFVTYPAEQGVWLDASGNAIGLGTPAAFVGTNITGTASGLSIGGNAATATYATSAGTVTTNANLTGMVTSVGNATSLGSFTSANLAGALTDETGSGSAVFATSPTLVTPELGTPSALVGTNITGTAAGLSIGGNAATATTAGTVTTNANLTGAVTSVGNATSLGSFTSANLAGALTDETGSGSAVFATSPTLVTPELGTPSSGTLTNCTFPTLNQNTTGTAGGLTGTPNITVGTVGCGAITASGAITSTGNVTAYFSDDRLKTRHGKIENALEKLQTLDGFYYIPNQVAQDLGYEAIQDVGVSAQSVQAILPEIVAPAPIDSQYLTVRYEKLVPLLIEAIKELTAKVKALEKRNDT